MTKTPVQLLYAGDVVLIGDEPEEIIDIKREVIYNDNDFNARYEVFSLTFNRRFFDDNTIQLFRDDTAWRVKPS